MNNNEITSLVIVPIVPWICSVAMLLEWKKQGLDNLPEEFA